MVQARYVDTMAVALRRRMWMGSWLTLTVALGVGPLAHAQSSPAGVHFQGQIVSVNGDPLLAPAVVFTLSVTNPGGTCVLYEETQTVNMTGSNGVFDLQLGAGTEVTTTGLAIADVFSNRALPGVTCYTPSAGDARLLKVRFNDGTQTVSLSTPYTISSVPYALYADSLQGKGASQFLQVNGTTAAATQTNLEQVFASAANVTQLLNLISGTSTSGGTTTFSGAVNFASSPTSSATPGSGTSLINKNYSDGYIGGKAADATLASLTAGDSGKVLGWNGTSWVATAVTPPTGGTVTSVGLTLPSIFTVGATPVTSSGNLSASLASQAQSAVFAGPASGSGAPTFRTLASGDLPTVLAAQGGTGLTSLTPNALMMANGTGTSLTSATCSTNQLLQWTGTAWSCQTFAVLANGFVNGGNAFAGAASLGTSNNNTLSLITNNSSRMTIDTSGKVGVGTTAPLYPLHVEGTIYSSTGLVTNGTLVAQAWENTTYLPSSTTAPNPQSYAQMNIGNSSATDSRAALIGFLPNNTAGVTQGAYFGAVSTSGAGNYTPSFVFGQRTGANSYAERLRIDTDGNVGIGTSTPAASLDIAKASTLTSGSIYGVNVTNANNPSAGSTANMVGISSAASFSSTNSAPTGSATGVSGAALNSWVSTLGNATGLDGFVSAVNGGVITNAYGAKVQILNSSSTITNAYGMHIGLVQGTNKWSLYASDATTPSYFAGNVGIGTTTAGALLDVHGHVANSGATATVSACGTSPGIAGNDTRGTVTLGSASPTACTVTFAAAYGSAPICVVTAYGGNPGATQWWITTSTTALVISFSATPTAGQKFQYHCMQ